MSSVVLAGIRTVSHTGSVLAATKAGPSSPPLARTSQVTERATPHGAGAFSASEGGGGGGAQPPPPLTPSTLTKMAKRDSSILDVHRAIRTLRALMLRAKFVEVGSCVQTTYLSTSKRNRSSQRRSRLEHITPDRSDGCVLDTTNVKLRSLFSGQI